MALVQWQESLSVGVGALDQDHRSMFSMLNQMNDALQDGTEGAMMAPLLDRLLLYTREHFAREEALMAECGYPDLAAHRREHQQLAVQVRALHQRLTDGSTESLGREVLVLFKTWLTSHIRVSDFLYKPYLVARTRSHDRGAPEA